ncbi:MAG: hypothetical protein ACOCVR_04090 [Myxococcota bacterium]
MARLEFDHTMPCRLDPAALADWLFEAVRDTEAVPIWPHGLNRVRIPRLEPGQLFEAEYRLPLRAAKLPYLVSEVLPGEGFSYAPAAGHPFHGLVHVRVRQHRQGSALAWFGSYEAPAWRPERAFFRFYFEPRFFRALGKGLAKL